MECRLDYQVSEKSPYLVISFRGIISQVTVPVMNECLEEVFRRNQRFVVLNFQDVSRVEPSGVAPILRLQTGVRKKQGFVRVCALRREIRNFLLESSAIRFSEISDNLLGAIQRLKEQSSGSDAA